MPMPLAAAPALVAKTDIGTDRESYLLVTASGAPVWVADPSAATPFASLREATRMAMRLPSAMRAFGAPRMSNVMIH